MLLVTCALIGSAVLTVTLVDSARIYSAWVASAPNCLRQ